MVFTRLSPTWVLILTVLGPWINYFLQGFKPPNWLAPYFHALLRENYCVSQHQVIFSPSLWKRVFSVLWIAKGQSWLLFYSRWVKNILYTRVKPSTELLLGDKQVARQYCVVISALTLIPSHKLTADNEKWNFFQCTKRTHHIFWKGLKNKE